MANGAKVAMAVGAGYLLGRRRKMRLALMLAAAGVTGRFPTSPTEVVAQGLKSLSASAELNQLTQQVRGELLGAARAAALAAATNQVNTINDRLQGVTSAADEAVDDVGGTVTDTVDTAGETLESVASLRRDRSKDDGHPDGDEDRYDEIDEEESADGYDDADDADYGESDEDEEPEQDEGPDEEEPPPVRRGRSARQPRAPQRAATTSRRRAPAATKRAPVRRGR